MEVFGNDLQNVTLDGFNSDFFGDAPNSNIVSDDLFLDMSSSSSYLDDNINSTYTLDNLLNVPLFDNNMVQVDMTSIEEILSNGGSLPGSGNQSPIREEYDLTSDDIVQLEEDKPKKRGRKKQKRDLTNENMDVTQVTISRENLLKITSDEYDGMIKHVSDQRALTFAESKHIKEQRRLIKNRESAQASRQRKKEHADSLAKQNEILRAENEALKKEIKSLKDEVGKLSGIIKKTTVSMTPTTKNGRIVALAILFSFGLFFFGLANKGGPNTSPSVRLHPNVGQRNLLQFDNVANLTTSPSTLSSAQIQTRPMMTEPTIRIQHDSAGGVNKITPSKVSIPISENARESRTEQFIESTTSPASSTGNDFTTARMEEFSNESNPSNPNVSRNLVINNESLTKFFDEEVIKYRRNTAYFTCSDFQQLTPLQDEAFDPNSPFYVSFIVPSSAMPNSKFAASRTIEEAGLSNGVVEINCQVIDVNIGQITAPVAMVS